MKYTKIISIYILFFFSYDAIACTGIIEGREDWVQLKVTAGIVFIFIVFLLSIISSIINWRACLRPILMGYSLFLLYYSWNAPIAIDTACRIWKEDLIHVAVALSIIVLILEVKTLSDFIKQRKNTKPINK